MHSVLAVALLLLIYCFMNVLLSMGILCWGLYLFALLYILSFDEEERTCCLACIVFRMSCYCKCFVALAHGVMCWSAVLFLLFPDHTQLLFRALFRNSVGFMKQMHKHSFRFLFVKT